MCISTCSYDLIEVQALLQWELAKTPAGFRQGAGIKRLNMYKNIRYNLTAKLRNIWSILINVLHFFKEQYTEKMYMYMYMNCPYLVTVLGRSSSSRVKAICPLCINKEWSNMIYQKQEFSRNNLGYINYISCSSNPSTCTRIQTKLSR